MTTPSSIIDLIPPSLPVHPYSSFSQLDPMSASSANLRVAPLLPSALPTENNDYRRSMPRGFSPPRGGAMGVAQVLERKAESVIDDTAANRAVRVGWTPEPERRRVGIMNSGWEDPLRAGIVTKEQALDLFNKYMAFLLFLLLLPLTNHSRFQLFPKSEPFGLPVRPAFTWPRLLPGLFSYTIHVNSRCLFTLHPSRPLPVSPSAGQSLGRTSFFGGSCAHIYLSIALHTQLLEGEQRRRLVQKDRVRL